MPHLPLLPCPLPSRVATHTTNHEPKHRRELDPPVRGPEVRGRWVADRPGRRRRNYAREDEDGDEGPRAHDAEERRVREVVQGQEHGRDDHDQADDLPLVGRVHWQDGFEGVGEEDDKGDPGN